MGRIGRSYPRFDEAQQPGDLPAEEDGGSALHVASAIVGILCALGFIGWFLSR